MSLCFFGKCWNDWMEILNNTLINDLNINKIDNIFEFNNNQQFAKYDFIFPLIENNMISLNKNLKDYKGIIMMPDIYFVETFGDKKKFANYVEDNNLSIYCPKTIKNKNDIKNMNMNTKIILKPPIACAGSGIIITNLKNYNHKYVVQLYIPNQIEYAVYLVVNKGKIIYNVAFSSEFKDDFHIKGRKNNDFIINKIKLEEKYINQLELFLVNYHGVCNIDLSIKDEKVCVFEINPRLGGSLFYKEYKSELIIILNLLFEIYKN